MDHEKSHFSSWMSCVCVLKETRAKDPLFNGGFIGIKCRVLVLKSHIFHIQFIYYKVSFYFSSFLSSKRCEFRSIGRYLYIIAQH